MIKYPKLKTKFKKYNKHLQYEGRTLPVAVLDFWQWAFSDFIDNTTRGIFAEFIVGYAIDSPTLKSPREGWGAYDLQFKDLKIEVKTSAYLQAWAQPRLSNIIFSISPTRAFDPQTGRTAKSLKRQADIYIFCVLTCKDQRKVDPLNLDQWEFYVVPTYKLDKMFGLKRKYITLKQLQILATAVTFRELKSTVEKTAHEIRAKKSRELE